MASQIQNRRRDSDGIKYVSGLLLIDAIQPVGIYSTAIGGDSGGSMNSLRSNGSTGSTGSIRTSSSRSGSVRSSSSASSASSIDDDANDHEAKTSWEIHCSRGANATQGFGGASVAVSPALLSASPEAHQKQLEITWYMERCYKHAQLLLSSYDPSRLSFASGLPVTLFKAGKASPFPRLLVGPARIQRIKRHICQRNGWNEDGLKTTSFRTHVLSNIAHDDIFAPRNVGVLQKELDRAEADHRF